jgi:aspartate carbamoyltransferase catalytic subunit
MDNILTFDDFSSLRPTEKGDYLLNSYGELRSFIYTQQIDVNLLEKLFKLAKVLKSAYPEYSFRKQLTDLLKGYSSVLYFTQPSTRTFTSFSLACKALGMHTEEIRDPNISSLYKGESELDTLLTLAELSHVIIMRQRNPSLIDEFSYELKRRGLETRVINGGSGSDQHPTQALLDVYTIFSSLGIDKNPNRDYTVTMMGDLKHSRTVRSLSYMLSMFKNIHQVFLAPEEFHISKDITDHLENSNAAYTKMTDKTANLLKESSCFYVVRIQDEYHVSCDNVSDLSNFKMQEEDMKHIKESSIVLHPLPRRDELPVELDYYPQAKYWEAVENGKFVRMALLVHMLGASPMFWHKLGKGDYTGL